MPEISPIIFDFGGGEVSPRFEGRVDSSLYRRSCRRLENFVVNAVGNAIRRSGSRLVEQLGLTPSSMKYVPFLTGSDIYMLLFTPTGGLVYVYKNGVQVHTFNTGTWSVDELPLIHTAQSGFDMYITDWDNAIHKLVKGSGDTSWTLSTPTITEFASAADYPKACTFYEQRLIVGGTHDNPQTIFGSEINDHENFTLITPSPTDEDPFEFEIATDYGHTIMWIVGEANLLVGTSYGEYQVYGGGGANNVNFISTNSITIKPFSAVGSNEVKAQISQDNVVFVQRSSKMMRELIFGFNVGRYQSPNISFLADHIIETGIKEIAFMSNPEPIVWILLTNETLVAVTRDRQQEILAWHRHPTDGDVQTIGILPAGPGQSEDQLWLAVERAGTSDPIIEYILPERFVTEDEIPVYVDSAVIVEKTLTEEANAFDYDQTGNNPTSYSLGATTTVNFAAAHPYAVTEGDVVTISGVTTETRLNGTWEVGTVTGNNFIIKYLSGANVDSSTWSATGAEGTCFKLSLFIETDQGAGTSFTVGDILKLSDFVDGGWDEDPWRDRVVYVHAIVVLPDTNTYLELWDEGHTTPLDPSGSLTVWTTAGNLYEVMRTITGLGHLEGESVQVLTDGGVHPNETVVSGQISLDWVAREAVAGMGYDSFLKPQRIGGSSEAITLEGMRKKVFKSTVRFFRTIGGEIGYDENHLEPILFRKGDQLMNQPPDIYTGDKEAYMESEFNTDGDILIAQRQPLPMTIVAIIPRTFVEEGTGENT